MRKLIVIATLAMGMWAAEARAESFVYGACKPYGDTGFYRCLSSDEQIVYTNALPSPEQETQWRKEYRKHQAQRAERMSRYLSPVVVRSRRVGPDVQLLQPAPKEKPVTKEQPKTVTTVVTKPVVTPVADCTNMQRMIDAWGRLALSPDASRRGTDTYDQMSTLERAIGSVVDRCPGK